MKILSALRLLWRSVLALNEAKITFFGGHQKLYNAKKYDYLFRTCHKQGVELVFFDSEKEVLYLKKDGITVMVDDYYTIFIELFVNKSYALPPQLIGNFCVFDAGMNRGYASLLFANHPSCTKVLGFELLKNTYDKALQNFALNKALSAKIAPHNFGLWNADIDIDIDIDKDGRTSIAPVENTALLGRKTRRAKTAVRKSSDVFAPLLAKHPNNKKVLKIDIEGAEYAVFEDLYSQRLLQQFDVIIGEAHNGLEGLEKYLEDFVCVNKTDYGVLITFCYINKRINT